MAAPDSEPETRRRAHDSRPCEGAVQGAGTEAPGTHGSPTRAALEANRSATDATWDWRPALGQIEALESAAVAEPAATMARLVALERKVLERELDVHLSQGQHTDEHPVRAALVSWRAQLEERGLDSAAGAVDTLLAQHDLARLRGLELVMRGSATDRAAAAVEVPSDSDSTFVSLLAVEELAVSYRERPSTLNGDPQIPDAGVVLAETHVVRELLQRELAGAAPHTHDQHARWVELAIDTADETLFAAGEVDPRRAADRLSRVVEQLTWHLDVLLPASETTLRERLARTRKRLEAERLEQLCSALLQRRFGLRLVAAWDRLIVAGLLAVLVLLVVELAIGGSVWTLRVDHGLCALFLWDFTVRAAQIGFHRTWLARHVITDFLPALPWTWLLVGGGVGADPARAGWLLRLLRLPRMARTVRLLAPLLRLVRAVGFLARGLDRLVRRHGRLLEREVLLFPTSAERRAARSEPKSADTTCFEARTRLERLIARTVQGAQESAPTLASVVGARTAGLRAAEDALHDPRRVPRPAAPRRAARPIAEEVFARLAQVTPAEVEAELGGTSVSRAARGVRFLARPPLAWLPILRGWVPRVAPDAPDDKLIAETVRTVARGMTRQHDRVLWWADLATTITPSEWVGRLGSTLVARTTRPAVRLLTVAGAYGLLSLALKIFGVDGAEGMDVGQVVDVVTVGDAVSTGELATGASDAGGAAGSGGADDAGGLVAALRALFLLAQRMIGTTLLVLGSVCLFFLAIGAWLQRLARDASTFQEQVAAAQFLHLTDSIKARRRAADAELLARRVFAPELRLKHPDVEVEAAATMEARRFEASLATFRTEGVEVSGQGDDHDPVARAVLLYSDHCGGALLGATDTRATGQLLGNLALRRLVERSGRLCAADLASLARIDLVRRRSLLNGPYLWFHAVTRAFASRAARAIVDFNAHAIPVVELERCSPATRAEYELWLADRLTEPSRREAARARRQLTSAFTVLHFLDACPARDDEVLRRFGPEVHARLVRSRRELVRSVLGCWPLARRPLEERVLNLRASYDRWIAGGRIFWMPLWVFARAGRVLRFAGARLIEAIQLVRHPERPLGGNALRQADFPTALRKIDRMRVPAAVEALRLRARFDPEYLGFVDPAKTMGSDAATTDGVAGEVERDLRFLRATPDVRLEIEVLRERTARDLARLADDYTSGLEERLNGALGIDLGRDPARRRALALAYHADLDGVRALLGGVEIILEAAREARALGLTTRALSSPWLTWRVWRWWPRARDAANAGGRDKAFARAVRAAIAHDLDGARAAFLELQRRGVTAARVEGERRLVELLRHPAELTEQLTTLRTVQTTTLLDVRGYRVHVHKLGQYELEDPQEEWAAAFEL